VSRCSSTARSGTVSKIFPAPETAKGKGKKVAGRATRNRRLKTQGRPGQARPGQASPARGNLTQAADTVKDAFKSVPRRRARRR
jgi:uncharacterized protein YjbJ (UPF0337 family)